MHVCLALFPLICTPGYEQHPTPFKNPAKRKKQKTNKREQKEKPTTSRARWNQGGVSGTSAPHPSGAAQFATRHNLSYTLTTNTDLRSDNLHHNLALILYCRSKWWQPSIHICFCEKQTNKQRKKGHMYVKQTGQRLVGLPLLLWLDAAQSLEENRNTPYSVSLSLLMFCFISRTVCISLKSLMLVFLYEW